MEREILFRGKSLDSGEWVEGNYSIMLSGRVTIQPIGLTVAYEVLPTTVGQFTGLTDKNGNRIFEGDIVKHEGKIYEMKYLEKYARFAPTNKSTVFMVCAFNHLEVVGNIHDNPELLNKGEQLCFF